MIYSSVKTEERATELVNAKAMELGYFKIWDTEIKKISVDGASGQIQAIQLVAYDIPNKEIYTVTCAFDDCEGDDDTMNDVIVVR